MPISGGAQSVLVWTAADVTELDPATARSAAMRVAVKSWANGAAWDRCTAPKVPIADSARAGLTVD